MIPINRPIIEKEEKEAAQRVLESLYLTDSSFEGGKFVREFERRFAEFVKVKHAVAVNSGTSALLAALIALNVKEGDETIAPGFTFASTATTSLFVKARIKLADIEQRTYCISIDEIKKNITNNTKIIIPVHLYGHPAKMDEVMEIAQENNISVIEDAAQSLGSEYKGRMTGGIGLIGCFSLYATKIITSGEGGVVTTNDDEIAERLRMIRSHGQHKTYDSKILGLNLRMPQIEAAIATEQMKKLDRFIKARRENSKFFNEELSKIKDVITPVEEDYAKSNWSIYTLYVKGKRDEIVQYLRENGVGAVVYYPIPLNKLPLFKDNQQCLPNCESAAEHVISLPVHPALSQEDRMKVVETLKVAVKKFL
ncbi:MAG: DegT/DnrJ/EryC1/StrS family aminotransferase [Nitrososphaeria archaeon]